MKEIKKEVQYVLADLQIKSLIINSLAGYDNIEITLQGVTFNGSANKLKRQIIRLTETFHALGDK